MAPEHERGIAPVSWCDEVGLGRVSARLFSNLFSPPHVKESSIPLTPRGSAVTIARGHQEVHVTKREMFLARSKTCRPPATKDTSISATPVNYMLTQSSVPHGPNRRLSHTSLSSRVCPACPALRALSLETHFTSRHLRVPNSLWSALSSVSCDKVACR